MLNASVTTDGITSCMTEQIEVKGKFEESTMELNRNISEQNIEVPEPIEIPKRKMLEKPFVIKEVEEPITPVKEVGSKSENSEEAA